MYHLRYVRNASWSFSPSLLPVWTFSQGLGGAPSDVDAGGERLSVETERWLKANNRNWQDLAAVCATVEDASRNTYVKLFGLDDPPTGKAARRAHVLILAIGGDPDSYGLETERTATWPTDKRIRDLLNSAWCCIVLKAA